MSAPTINWRLINMTSSLLERVERISSQFIEDCGVDIMLNNQFRQYFLGVVQHTVEMVYDRFRFEHPTGMNPPEVTIGTTTPYPNSSTIGTTMTIVPHGVSCEFTASKLNLIHTPRDETTLLCSIQELPEAEIDIYDTPKTHVQAPNKRKRIDMITLHNHAKRAKRDGSIDNTDRKNMFETFVVSPDSTEVKVEARRHIDVQSTDKPFKCIGCEATFKAGWRLNHHMKSCRAETVLSKTTDTTLQVRSYECYLCRHEVRYRHRMFEHMRSHHTGVKPFKCKICSKAFAVRMMLGRHLRKHYPNLSSRELTWKCIDTTTEGMPFKCKDCSRPFRLKAHLDRHMNTCTSKFSKIERQYECYLCKHITAWKYRLFGHMRSKHTGEKPYQCNVCHKESVGREQMMMHLRIHFPVMPTKQLAENYKVVDVSNVH